MVTSKERLASLIIKFGRALLTDDTTESPEQTEESEDTTVHSETEPMKVYWDSDLKSLGNRNQNAIDLFLMKGGGLKTIPGATGEPINPSRYKYEKLYNLLNGVTDTPKVGGTGISSSGRDAGVVAGIVIAVISGIIILAGLIAVVMYKHYVHRNVTSMNFDNPVYRKTTEDQFALEKNGYAPGSKLYPSTVGEEAQEPLNTPGTNEFV